MAARKSPGGAEILRMAVDPARRGRGGGTVLLDRMLDELAADEVSVVVTTTLDHSAGYPPYEVTRTFWERRGFIQIDTIDPLPGWQPGNPAAIYVAALRPTRQRAPNYPFGVALAVSRKPSPAVRNGGKCAPNRRPGG